MNVLLRIIFKLLGWKVIGKVDPQIKKAILAVAPHNSWKDFLVGISARAAMRLDIKYLGKAELFKPPFGFIFKGLGGTPVYRSEKMNMVDSQVAVINSFDEILIGIAPEGTRKNVSKLKTGFYYMAVGANIPIIRVGFDLAKKEVIIANPFHPSGDFASDMKKYFIPFFEKMGGVQKNWINNYKNDIF
ncbi:MAG TPA: 1-acyl-sn-glycerol-3-phosphate acyltransferase [Leadbetterella sp.]|nr:1-acyl-sn-glycerol-3-phosphate acyltransferase [Leadbetterella sp.]